MRVKSYPIPQKPGYFMLALPATRKLMWLAEQGENVLLHVFEDETTSLTVNKFLLVRSLDPISQAVSGLQKVDTIGIGGEYLHLLEVATDPSSGGAHASTHEVGGGDPLTANLNATARVAVRKNSGTNVGARRRLNLIEGDGIILTTSDDLANEEVDIEIAADDDAARYSLLTGA